LLPNRRTVSLDPFLAPLVQETDRFYVRCRCGVYTSDSMGCDGFTGCDGLFGKKTCQNLNAFLKGPLTDSCAVSTCCKAGDI